MLHARSIAAAQHGRDWKGLQLLFARLSRRFLVFVRMELELELALKKVPSFGLRGMRAGPEECSPPSPALVCFSSRFRCHLSVSRPWALERSAFTPPSPLADAVFYLLGHGFRGEGCERASVAEARR